jgi:hypothetical protein
MLPVYPTRAFSRPNVVSVRGEFMPDHRDKEQETEREVEKQATTEKEDPLTSREALEEELMEEGRSEEGENIP